MPYDPVYSRFRRRAWLGPDTPGKRAPDDSYREFHFTKPTIERIGAQLQKEYENVSVYYTHDLTGKTDVSINARVSKANAIYKKHLADIKAGRVKMVFVSLHSNGTGSGSEWIEGTARGSETLISDKKFKEAYSLALEMERQVQKQTGRPSRGIVETGDRVGVLSGTHMTAVLHEAAFHTSRTDLALLKSQDFRDKVARGIINTLASFYGLKKRAAAAPAAAPAPKPTPKPEPAPVKAAAEPVTSFKEAREWVVEKGISDGSSPKEPALREEVFEMLYRLETGKQSKR